MFRALYDYKSTVQDYLSFEAGDKFTALRQSHGDWIQVENGFGEIGFVPRNYVVEETDAALSEVLQSIDRAIQNIHYQSAASGSYSHLQRENLQKLSQHRENVLKEYRSGAQNSATGTKNVLVKQNSKDSKAQKRTSIKRAAPSPPQSSTAPTLQHYVSQSSKASSAQLNHQQASYSQVAHRDSQNYQSGSHVHQHYQTQSHHSQSQVANKGSHDLNSFTASLAPKHKLCPQTRNSTDVLGDKHSNEHCPVTDTVENGWVNVSHGSKSDNIDTVDSNLMDNLKEESCEDNVLNETRLTGRGNKELYHTHSSDTDEHRLQQSNLVTSTDSVSSSQVLSPVRSVKSLPTSPSRQLASPSIINLGNLPMPSNLASEIIEEVRKHTGLSYDKSGLAVEVVLGHIASRVPQTAALMDKIMATTTETGNTSDEEESYDAKKIEEIFTKLTECKEDSQQRSWALYEDQQNILSSLEELLSVLENAKPSICRREVARDNYDSLHNLVQYYQMESRVVIRQSLLKVFGAMCTLEAAVISHLLYSILPTELVSEIQSQYEDAQRLSYVTLLLTMIFCTGEPTPLTLQEQMDQGFWDFVLDQVETPCSTDHEDQCTDLLVHLILAYNLHILDVQENIVMKTLGHKGTAKVFTEKLLLIFNRGEDPVKMFDYQTSQPNSVMKFMHDMYSQQSTATLLYTNDAKVLIDIIIRQLTDLQPGDQIRSSYLTLTKLLVMNSDYFEHEHRLAELCERLMAINKEETGPQNDKEEATRILEEFNSHL